LGRDCFEIEMYDYQRQRGDVATVLRNGPSFLPIWGVDRVPNVSAAVLVGVAGESHFIQQRGIVGGC
jgi:hypothetical protein